MLYEFLFSLYMWLVRADSLRVGIRREGKSGASSRAWGLIKLARN